MCNVMNVSGVKEWHNLGFKGKGIKVLVGELQADDYHANSVAEIVRSYAPEAYIEVYDYDDYQEEKMIDYAIKNNFDIINTSYGINYPKGTFIETRAKNAYRKALDHGILIVKSAGNQGLNTIKDNGLLDLRMINVGMVEKNLNIPRESSWGNGEVDCGGLVGHKLDDGTYMWGTSESAPYVSGLLAVLLSKEKITLKQVLLYISENSIPINERVGAGLFRLPSFANPLSVEMFKTNGTKTFVHKDFALETLNLKGYRTEC